MSVRSYLYLSPPPAPSKANSNLCTSSARPMTTSVRPRRVPRQPRGPAPKGSQQKVEGAPPVLATPATRAIVTQLKVGDTVHQAGELPETH